MEKLEKVQMVSEKCNVSYAVAKEALEACDYDVLDAILKLEREGKATFATKADAEAETISEEATYETGPQSEKATGKARKVWNEARVMKFIAEHNGEQVVSIPLILAVVGIFFWGAFLWLMIIGLFFGFRYRIEGTGSVVSSVNGAMDKVADVADDVKREFA